MVAFRLASGSVVHVDKNDSRERQKNGSADWYCVNCSRTIDEIQDRFTRTNDGTCMEARTHEYELRERPIIKPATRDEAARMGPRVIMACWDWQHQGWARTIADEWKGLRA